MEIKRNCSGYGITKAGWRGFALPRLQECHGPLVGTLVLGSLGALWHLSIWLFIPGYIGAGTGFIGIGIPFLGWAVMTVSEATDHHGRWNALPGISTCENSEQEWD